jgi:50S ribosomal protein L16 3-hydroxylase
MLYLPPRWAHDGVALDECQTWSIGFRASAAQELGRELLQRLSDRAEDLLPADLYRDPAQPATATPAQVPEALLQFSSRAVQRLAQDPQAIACALGEYLSEPKPQVWFEPAQPVHGPWAQVQLDRRTRMLWDARHIFINGESFVVGGRDARVLRGLADQRCLDAAALRSLSTDASQALHEWCAAGWAHAQTEVAAKGRAKPARNNRKPSV